MNRSKGELYRNVEQGKIAGICAGIADYLGWETWLIRVLVVSAVLFGLPFLILGYIAAWFILDETPGPAVKADQAVSKNPYAKSQQPARRKADITKESIKVKARIWQAGEPAKQALYDIRRKFSALETRVQGMEQYVTSKKFTIHREINKL
ncbi:MAG: envelope stress response membrane protein PspC [Colwellia sp.]